jgi:hypothetical protein
VLATYAAFVVGDLLWWHIRWKDGSTVYDFAVVGIGFFWLGVIGLAKLSLRWASPNASSEPCPPPANQSSKYHE